MEYVTEQMLASVRGVADSQNRTVEEKLKGIFEVLYGDPLAVSSQVNIAELLAVARSQEGNIVSRFDAGVISIIGDTLTWAGTAAHWERHGIGAQELAKHLIDTSTGIKSATDDASEYRRRMALAIRIIVAGADGAEP